MIVFLTRVRMKLIAFVSVLALSIFGLIGSASAGGLASAPKTVDHRATIADKAPVAKVGYRYRRSYRRGHRRFRLRFGRHYGYRHRHYSHRHYRYKPYRYRHYGYYRPHYKRRHYRLKRFYRNRHLRRHFRRHLRRW
ncbi:hypothetical protein NBRC116602_04490 [Hyphomicrobiales bacterium 4NK60-0047b]